MRERGFKDWAKVYVASGRGGDGAASFRREKFIPFGGPDGGDGGRGGHVFMVADANEDSLLDLTYAPHQKAEDGAPGTGRQCTGKNGQDLHIKVPCGTMVFEHDTGEFITEVLKDGEEVMLARGGRGGKGNLHFVSSTHQAPREFTPGGEGEAKTLRLELKLLADVGLVGFPNAGKSTLLSRLSRAHPKIAAYPFTTLNPMIGIVEYDDFFTLRVADVPGLIEGAHLGAGLGHDFLRHIERTRLLVFLVDMAGVDGRRPEQDYVSLRNELRLYRRELDERPYIIVANKMDLPDSWDNFRVFTESVGEIPHVVSAEHRDGIDQLKHLLRVKMEQITA